MYYASLAPLCRLYVPCPTFLPSWPLWSCLSAFVLVVPIPRKAFFTSNLLKPYLSLQSTLNSISSTKFLLMLSARHLTFLQTLCHLLCGPFPHSALHIGCWYLPAPTWLDDAWGKTISGTSQSLSIACKYSWSSINLILNLPRMGGRVSVFEYFCFSLKIAGLPWWRSGWESAC